MKKLFLSVIIPAYNEEKNIRLGALDKVLRYLEKQSYTWEVIIVDDGSTDKTGELITSFTKQREKVVGIHNEHQGKAATVITGMLKASGFIVLFCDLDQATPISEVEKILPFFTKGFDVVIGSRNRERQGAPLLRRIMARGFMLLRTYILGLKGITDTQCGFKAFRGTIVTELFNKLRIFGTQKQVNGSMVTAGFDIEVLFLAKQLGFKIKEVPVEWHYVETRRVNPLTDSWQGLRDILKIRLNALKGYY